MPDLAFFGLVLDFSNILLAVNPGRVLMGFLLAVVIVILLVRFFGKRRR